MVAQSLLVAPNDSEAFQRSFAWRLRWWIVGLPAGVGFASLRACLKLWLGFSPEKAGVYSAGNGPAMRSALLGVYFADAPDLRHRYVRASARLTHHDPRAAIAAAAVAETAAHLVHGCDGSPALFTALEELSTDSEWRSLAARLRGAFANGEPVDQFAHSVGATHGVSGYAYQTAPVAIYAALVHRDDFDAALGAAIACGGDTDTVSSIVGALVGARVGASSIPKTWKTDLADWPRSIHLLEKIGVRLRSQQSVSCGHGPVRYFWPAIPLRNLFFLGIVLVHGFRRLFPPYGGEGEKELWKS